MLCVLYRYTYKVNGAKTYQVQVNRTSSVIHGILYSTFKVMLQKGAFSGYRAWSWVTLDLVARKKALYVHVYCVFAVEYSTFRQVDEEDTSRKPWNNLARHTRVMIAFLHKAVSDERNIENLTVYSLQGVGLSASVTAAGRLQLTLFHFLRIC